MNPDDPVLLLRILALFLDFFFQKIDQIHRKYGNFPNDFFFELTNVGVFSSKLG